MNHVSSAIQLLEVNHIPNVTVFAEMSEAFVKLVQTFVASMSR